MHCTAGIAEACHPQLTPLPDAPPLPLRAPALLLEALPLSSCNMQALMEHLIWYTPGCTLQDIDVMAAAMLKLGWLMAREGLTRVLCLAYIAFEGLQTEPVLGGSAPQKAPVNV